MIILRDQLFSSYSEVPIEGYSYYPSQVLTNYALDPLEKSADWIENTAIVGDLKPIKKKTRMVKKVTASLKSLVKRKDNNK
jgi:hypothetical protein